MNVKRYLMASFAAFVFICGFQFLFHSVLLADAYEATANLWRVHPTDGPSEYCYFGMASQLFLALTIGFLFTRNYEGKGVSEGVRFGAYIGILLAVVNMGAYAYMPIDFTLVTAWMLGSLVTGVGSGVILSLVYKK